MKAAEILGFQYTVEPQFTLPLGGRKIYGKARCTVNRGFFNTYFSVILKIWGKKPMCGKSGSVNRGPVNRGPVNRGPVNLVLLYVYDFSEFSIDFHTLQTEIS